MFNLPIFVGIDYHQQTIQVCVMDQQRKILTNQTVGNDPEAVFRVVAPFGSNVHAAIEASTGVADFAEILITHYKWHVELAHPGYVARMKQTPDKSDWTDAKQVCMKPGDSLSSVSYTVIRNVFHQLTLTKEHRKCLIYQFSSESTTTNKRFRSVSWTNNGKS